MTNEEHEKLCAWLRHLPSYLDTMGCEAADEIERLAAQLKQLNEALRLARPYCVSSEELAFYKADADAANRSGK